MLAPEVAGDEKAGTTAEKSARKEPDYSILNTTNISGWVTWAPKEQKTAQKLL